jgi:hypothetical protein
MQHMVRRNYAGMERESFRIDYMNPNHPKKYQQFLEEAKELQASRENWKALSKARNAKGQPAWMDLTEKQRKQMRAKLSKNNYPILSLAPDYEIIKEGLEAEADRQKTKKRKAEAQKILSQLPKANSVNVVSKTEKVKLNKAAELDKKKKEKEQKEKSEREEELLHIFKKTYGSTLDTNSLLSTMLKVNASMDEKLQRIYYASDTTVQLNGSLLSETQRGRHSERLINNVFYPRTGNDIK